ncbi:MAG: preprotein translocase subunit SecE [Kiritimatiellia bacterium]
MNIFKKAGDYLSGVGSEAKRVTWPGKRELWESTLVVISFIFILAVTIAVCDHVIGGGLDFLLSRAS